MLVKNWMSQPVVTIDVNDSMHDATNLIEERNIRFLPVMERAKLVGVLTDGDLKKASASGATTLDVHELLYLLSKLKVKSLMTKNVIAVPLDFTVEETADILLKNRISGVPVLDTEDQLVGVITQDDIFRVLISLTGIIKLGVQFACRIEDRPGSIKELTDVIRDYGGRIVSILTSYEGAPRGYRNVYLRAFRMDRDRLDRLTAELQEKAQMLYMVDHREEKRVIYSE